MESINNGTEGFQTVLPTWSPGYLALGFSSRGDYGRNSYTLDCLYHMKTFINRDYPQNISSLINFNCLMALCQWQHRTALDLPVDSRGRHIG
jgi:hypothetical protein